MDVPALLTIPAGRPYKTLHMLLKPVAKAWEALFPRGQGLAQCKGVHDTRRNTLPSCSMNSALRNPTPQTFCS